MMVRRPGTASRDRPATEPDVSASRSVEPGRLGDVWGGLAAMLVAFPSSIAFGAVIYSAAAPELAGQGALAGVLGAAALGLLAPIVGRNPGFISAPCAPAAAVLSGFAAELSAHAGLGSERILGLLALTALLAAALQVLLGALRAGRLIKYIPHQVVSGYLSGVGLIIALAQLPKLLGTPSGLGLGEALLAPARWSAASVIVGLVTLAVCLATPRLSSRVPATIVGLAAGTACYFGLGLAWPELLRLEGNPLLLGPVEASGSLVEAARGRLLGLAALRPSDLALVAGPAATLAVLLSIDTLKTGVVLDALLGRRHASNRELLAQGAGNAAAFLVGGVPGAGTMGPSLVNVTSGARTTRASVLEGALVVVAWLALGGLLAWLPVAALAGLLLAIAWRMLDLRAFRLLAQRDGRLDFFVIASVVAVAVGIGLIQASVVGVCLAILLFIRDQIRGNVILGRHDLRQVHSKRRRPSEEWRVLDEVGAAAELVRLQGNLFFGTTDQLFSQLEADLDRRRFLLLDFRRVLSMDYTAAQLLHQLARRLREHGGALLFCGMPAAGPRRRDLEDYLEQVRLLGEGGAGARLFDTREQALEWIEARLLEAAGRPEAEPSRPLPLSGMSLLRDLPDEVLAALEGLVRERSAPAGERLLAADEEGDEIVLVRRGLVHVLLPLASGKRHHVATVGPGEAFGEMSFLDRSRRSAEAVAAEPTEYYLLARGDFDRLAESDPRFASVVFERLSRELAARLRSTSAELRAVEER
jgi:SulP family sulfate permease